MTREVARRRIEALDYSLQSNFGDYGERDHEAMKMAIEALSAEPCIASASEWCRQNGYVMMPEAVYEQEITKAYFEGQNANTCDVCVSKQEVDDLVDELARAISDERCCIPRGRSTATIMRDIIQLPPVTPKHETIHWIKINKKGNKERG